MSKTDLLENSPQEQESATKKAKKKGSFLDGWKFFFFCVLLAMIFRTFIYSPFHIPSASMKSTLLIGDFIFVSKYSYGFSKYSIPYGYNFKYFDGRIAGKAPKRGDIVVFRPPKKDHINYIKRLIGLPGDRIRVSRGELYINDVKVPKRRVDDFVEDMPDGSTKRIKKYVETLPNGVTHYVLDERFGGKFDDTKEFLVPEKHYFFMGDNRDNSQDSRSKAIGFVPEENLIGLAQKIAFSTKSKIWEFWKWPTSLRKERFWSNLQLSKQESKRLNEAKYD